MRNSFYVKISLNSKRQAMHEYSIINDLITQCENIAESSEAKAISRIIIGVGELGGVDSSLLDSAFNAFKCESSVCENAILEIQKLPIKLLCLDCKQESTIKREETNYAVCLYCKSNNTQLVSGNDMLLLSVELEVEEN